MTEHVTRGEGLTMERGQLRKGDILVGTLPCGWSLFWRSGAVCELYCVDQEGVLTGALKVLPRGHTGMDHGALSRLLTELASRAAIEALDDHRED